jgi:hypothetical protein
MVIGTVGTDGTFSALGTLTGFAGTPTGLAWDWDNQVMYVMMLNGSNLPNLCTLDMGTLALTQVGSAGTAMIIGIDFANDGYIYGPSLTDENLYRYDPVTGAETLIGSTGLGLNYGQDVSFDPQDNLLYTISCGDQYYYGTYDLTTGAFTQIANFSGNQHATFVITKVPIPAEAEVTFAVDMNTQIALGDFVPGTDIVYIAGSPWGWAEPGTYTVTSLELTDGNGDGVYSNTFTIEGGDIEYKYFQNAGWDGGEW